MKSLLISIGILVAVLGVSIFGALLTDRQLEHFYNGIEATIPEGATDAAKIYESAIEIENEYESLRKFIILFIHDDEVREIEEHLSDIKSAAEADEVGEAMMAKSRLLLHIKQLRRLSKFSPEAIF